MQLATQNSQRLTHGPVGVAHFARMLLESVVIVGTLAITTLAFGDHFTGAYMILALLVFSLTFPGQVPKGTSAGALADGVFSGWLLIVGLLLMLGWATHTMSSFDQRVLIAWISITPFALVGAHLLMQALVPRLLGAQGVQRRAVIVGAGVLGHNLAERIATVPDLGVHVTGFFDDRGADRLPPVSGTAVLGGVTELVDYVKAQRVNLIYVTLPIASQPRVMQLLDELRDTTASVYFIPDISHFDLIQGHMETIGGMPVLAVCDTPFSGINAMVKRLSDIVLGALILVLIAPVMLAIAIGVKATSRGPILFRQRRYGLEGCEIVVYKFRSMTVAEDGAVVTQATRNDRRVTPFGAFLRRTSLDELPQFVNVLQGRMSIVGPRPHAVAHNEQYRKLVKSYMIRHKVRPGITGWAQVNGLRGETDTLDKMKARIEYDLAYLRNWTLGLDLYIIWRTVFVVFAKQNAY